MGEMGNLRTKGPRASIDAMLAFAWDAGTFTATEAMLDAGLTRSTAIDAIGELIELGLLRELPNARAAGEYVKGRPSRRFELRAEAAVIVGMDAGRAHLTTTVANLRGVELARERVDLDSSQDTRQGRRSAIIDALDSALHSAGSHRDQVLCVCIGVPAPVDFNGDSPEHREGFWHRMNPGLRDLVAEWAPIQRIENDASLAAVAEGSVGVAQGLINFVVLLAGDRFGAGVVIDGHLLRGHHGGVGELRAFEKVRGVESADGVGLRLAEWAQEEWVAGAVPQEVLARVPGELLTGRAVLRLSSSGDDWARRLVSRAGALLARITTVFSSFYDPSCVVVAGAVADDLDEVLEAARALLVRDVGVPAPALVRSQLGADAVVTGAVSAARETALREVLRLEPSTLERLRGTEGSSTTLLP